MTVCGSTVRGVNVWSVGAAGRGVNVWSVGAAGPVQQPEQTG